MIMQKLDMGKEILEDLYKVKSFEAKEIESEIQIDQIPAREKFKAAKQILLGIAILYLITIFAYLLRPVEGNKLLDIITITFPPLATLILAAYFRDKNN